MGGIPTNYMSEALSPRPGDFDATVPGLMALGKASCASVHGANRLGSNSLIDLVVFGRAAGHRCAETIDTGQSQPDLPVSAGEQAIARLDRLRHAERQHAHGGCAAACSTPCRTTARCSATRRC